MYSFVKNKIEKQVVSLKQNFSVDEVSGKLFSKIRYMIDAARNQVSRAVNTGLVMLYWHIGDRIRKEILGQGRAPYGEKIVATLLQQLGWSHFTILIAIKDLELAILREIEQFLIEIGTDFSFVARQKRMSIGDKDYFLDLMLRNFNVSLTPSPLMGEGGDEGENIGKIISPHLSPLPQGERKIGLMKSASNLKIVTLHNSTDFEHDHVRENAYLSSTYRN